MWRKTTYDSTTKLFTTMVVAEGEKEELVRGAPLWLLRLFGVTGQLSWLMWQVECQVRDNPRRFGPGY